MLTWPPMGKSTALSTLIPPLSHLAYNTQTPHTDGTVTSKYSHM